MVAGEHNHRHVAYLDLPRDADARCPLRIPRPQDCAHQPWVAVNKYTLKICICELYLEHEKNVIFRSLFTHATMMIFFPDKPIHRSRPRAPSIAERLTCVFSRQSAGVWR